MSFLHTLFDDPPPLHAFELSAGGIAFAARPNRRGQQIQLDFRPLPEGVIEVSPVKDNVSQPQQFAALVASLVEPNGHKKPKPAALILPDYCARVSVLEFETLPAKREEQLALVRFRLKKTVPFDIDSAAVNFHAYRTTVVAVAASYEIVARYELPFRQAGYDPGFATTSVLAAMDPAPPSGLSVLVKLTSRVLTVAVCDGRVPKLVRCMELTDVTMDEILAVLFPTLAYAEDEMHRKPARLLQCGFGEEAPRFRDRCETELGLTVEPLRSQWGPAGDNNAGLLGWLQAQEER